MKQMMMQLWTEQTGAIVSMEIILIATILVIGLIAGLTSVRDAVVTELADVGQAIANLNQSYSFGGVCGHCAITSGSSFFDQLDFCDSNESFNAVNSKCIAICFGVNPSTGG